VPNVSGGQRFHEEEEFCQLKVISVSIWLIGFQVSVLGECLLKECLSSGSSSRVQQHIASRSGFVSSVSVGQQFVKNVLKLKRLVFCAKWFCHSVEAQVLYSVARLVLKLKLRAGKLRWLVVSVIWLWCARLLKSVVLRLWLKL
jgi:hypothetical protein